MALQTNFFYNSKKTITLEQKLDNYTAFLSGIYQTNPKAYKKWSEILEKKMEELKEKEAQKNS
jgi:hypothetical protein